MTERASRHAGTCRERIYVLDERSTPEVYDNDGPIRRVQQDVFCHNVPS